MATTLPQPRNKVLDIADTLSKIAPVILGSGETRVTPNVDPTALAQSDEITRMLMERSSSTAQTDKVIEDILYRAQLAFAPVLAEEKSAGMYNTTTRMQLAREATNRATAAAAAAVLQDQQAAMNAAVQANAARMQATKGSTQRTSPQLTTENLLKGVGLVAGTQILATGAKKNVYDPLAKKAKELWEQLTKYEDPATDALPQASGDIFDQEAFSTMGSDIGTPIGFGDGGSVGFGSELTGGGGADIVVDPTSSAVAESLFISTAATEGGAAGVDAGTEAGAEAVASGAGATIASPYAMPPAIPVDPITGMPNAMPPAIPPGPTDLDLPAEMDFTDFGAESAVEAGTESAVESSVEGAFETAGASEAAGGGVGAAGWLSAGLNLAEGDPRAATGNLIGGAAGTIFGGPLGGAVGSYVGGQVYDPLMDKYDAILEDVGGENFSTLMNPLGSLTETTSLPDNVSNYFEAAGDMGQHWVSEVNEELDSVFDDLGDAADSVICTEAEQQGLINIHLVREEKYVNMEIRKLSPYTVRGYHYLAAPIVFRMRKDRKFAERMARYATAYCEQVTGIALRPVGLCIKWIGEPICYLVGRFIVPASFDYRKVIYGE